RRLRATEFVSQAPPRDRARRASDPSTRALLRARPRRLGHRLCDRVRRPRTSARGRRRGPRPRALGPRHRQHDVARDRASRHAMVRLLPQSAIFVATLTCSAIASAETPDAGWFARNQTAARVNPFGLFDEARVGYKTSLFDSD